MARWAAQTQRKGVEAALDLVEDALASLQKRVQQEAAQQRNAASNTVPAADSHSGTSSKSSHIKGLQLPHKETSVLLRRKSRARSRRSKKHSSHGDRHERPESGRDATKRPGRQKRSTHLAADTTTTSSSLSSTSERMPGRGKSKPSRYTRKKSVREDDDTLDDTSSGDSPQGRRHSSHHPQRERDVNKHRSHQEGRDRHRSPPQEVPVDRPESYDQQRYKHKSQRRHSRENSDQQQEKVTYHRRGGKSGVKRGHKSVSEYNFAQPTLTTKLRGELQQKETSKKENIVPFIPCGSEGQSHHVGVVIQQQLGRINTLRHDQIPDLAFSQTVSITTPSPSHPRSHTSHCCNPDDDERKRRREVKSKVGKGDESLVKSKGKKRSKGRSGDSDQGERKDVNEETVRRALPNILHYINLSATSFHHKPESE